MSRYKKYSGDAGSSLCRSNDFYLVSLITTQIGLKFSLTLLFLSTENQS